MVNRYYCNRCKKIYRKNNGCTTCNVPLSQMELEHTEYGILMYIFAMVSAVMIAMAFIGFGGFYVLYAFGPMIIAFLMNILDDKQLDKNALTKIIRTNIGMSCPDCHQPLSFNYQYQRWYCASCRIYIDAI